METSDQDFIIHVTVDVDAPKPFDCVSVLTRVPASVAVSVPVTSLLSNELIGDLVVTSTEREIIQHILKMEPRDYERAKRRGDKVPELPEYHVAGFALVQLSHLKRDPKSYPKLAEIFGIEVTDATD